MPSYSIAILAHTQHCDDAVLEALDAYRDALPFAQLYLYTNTISNEQRSALHKRDVVIRHDDGANRFKLMRRMCTEVDADVFVMAAPVSASAQETNRMIHQLVEGRKDMVVATGMHNSETESDYRRMCQALYGVDVQNPLSPWRVFSRRFVKSFAAFERGFPVELEWTIHALELDVPMQQYDAPWPEENLLLPAKGTRHSLNRLILNLQARPLKWFGSLTAINLLGMAIYCAAMLGIWAGYDVPLHLTHAAVGSGIFAILAFVSALSGLALHSISYERRELKRLHFQQHSTL